MCRGLLTTQAEEPLNMPKLIGHSKEISLESISKPRRRMGRLSEHANTSRDTAKKYALHIPLLARNSCRGEEESSQTKIATFYFQSHQTDPYRC
jgi:hypothetical protein